MALTSKLTAIGDAIRTCDGTTEPMTLDVMPERIKALTDQQGGEWKRPAAWPDLDAAFEAEGTGDVALWTVANALGGVVCFEVTRDSGEWTLERGSVVDGAFVASETVYSGTANYVQVDVSGTGYTVYRAKPTTEGSMFTMARINASNADCTTACSDMAIVEVAERVSMLQESPNGGSYMYNWGSNHTERIRIELTYKGSGTKAISFAMCFFLLSGLRSLDMSNWDTSGWNVTALNNMFYGCASLTSVTMSGWDTSGWNVTTLANMFYCCTSLESVNMSGWDTSNWNVTTLGSMFYCCTSLESVNMSGWDTSGWNVTALNSMFYYCASLESVDMSNWDTSGWNVTTLANMFSYCTSLTSVNMSGWDTSGWNVTTLNSMFYYCASLESVDMSNWDTSGWNVTTLNSMFSYCTSLESVNMSGWDTSNWNVTTLANMFSYCYCLTDLVPPTAWFSQATSLSQSQLLTRESARALIDALPTTASSLTLTLQAYAKARLTDDDIAAATAKGWKIA